VPLRFPWSHTRRAQMSGGKRLDSLRSQDSAPDDVICEIEVEGRVSTIDA
jgi:hypothetical protein